MKRPREKVKLFARVRVCNLFSFEVSDNVMTMACTTPKRNGLSYEFLLPHGGGF
jgi:hypothetical protein